MRQALNPTNRQPRRTAKVLRGPLRRGLALLALALSGLAFALPASASADIGICSAGTGAGNCENAQGLAVDSETGRLYVADSGNNRIDVFEDGPGHKFAFAFGWGVANGGAELQSCGPQATPPTANCLKGLASGGAGAFNGTTGVSSGAMSDIAVDNDPTSSSQHDIYVLDGRRVQKFDAEGNFLLTWGGGVITGGASGTGNLSAGSNQITAVKTTSKRFATGQTITGAGIPAGTKITSLGSETITLSKAATASGTGVALSVTAGVGNKVANEIDRLVNKGEASAAPNFAFNTPPPNPPPSRTELGQLPNSTTCPQLQGAFEALSNVGPGNVACIGEKVEGNVHEYTVEFKGPRYSDADVSLQPANSSGNREVITKENGGGAAEICTAAIEASCSAGVQGNGAGQLAESAHLAVGPGGIVYVIDCVRENQSVDWPLESCENRLQKFEPSGDFVEELDLPQSGNPPTGVAVNSTGDFYVSVTVAAYKYDPAGNLLKELPFGAGALATDASDHLFAAGGLVIAEYDATDNIVRRFGYGVLKSGLSGLAHFPVAGNDIYSAEGGSVFYRAFPPPGPIVVPGPCKTSFLGNAKAILLAEVNPEGKATTVHFEYISDADFIANGNSFSGAHPAKETAESESIGSDFKLHDAEAQAELVPETKYHCRVVATNADAPGGLIGEEGTFTSKAPLELGVTYVSGVGSETATLNATVSPLGISASGFFEYVEEATYLKDVEELGPGHGFDHAAKAPDVDAAEKAIDFESGESFKLGSAQLSGLKPATSYRFRIVATDVLIAPEGKAFAGPSKGFRTFGSGAGALPDDRGYELVSPAQKNSAEVAVPGNSAGFTEDRFIRISAGATSGEAVTYTSFTSFGDDAEGAQAASQYLSKRTPSGWATENISPFGFVYLPTLPPYSGFSPDLRFGAFKTTEPVLTADCRKGLESLYLRDNETGELHCLSPETPGAPESPCLVYAGISEDGSRAFLAGAPEGGEELTYSLYEWSAANGIQLVSVLPNGEPAPATDGTAFGRAGDRFSGIENCQVTRTVLRHAISADGSRVFWTNAPDNEKEPTQLYARVNGSETVQLDQAANPKNSGNGVFRAASADGSVVYFTDENKLVSEEANPEKGKPDLYRYQFGVSKAQTLTDLTKGSVAGDVRGVVGASDDGSYLYFVAGAVLSPDPNSAGQVAEAGKNNLYLNHEGQTSFIATLATEDSGDWEANPRLLRARVSPDGRHLAFLSIEAQKLAGYDNTIAAGEHCQYQEPTTEEVQLTGSPLCPQAFLYEADDGELSCASCNPSGSRPLGPTVVPGWRNGFEGPRFLSDDGQRLFFQSFDAILRADENGKGDVYEFERTGSGSCSEADSNFDPSAGGCHYLVSSGKSEDESYLVDASADGRDVFFSTRERLVGWDENDNFDIYDLREGGGFPEPPPVPPVCDGEGCKAPSPPVPPANPAPASAGFQGPGNVSSPTSSRCPKGKVRRKARCVKSRHGKSQRQKRDHRRASGKGRTGR
jgi:NHL repeat